ncbi:MAG: SusC/RagA family TonB-linked outer membrane protein [Chitinophagales bacterium]
MLSMLMVTTVAFAQEKTITGTITDGDTGETLPTANVVVKGTTTGTVTDFDGKYTLKASVGDVLVFSFVGYGAEEVTVGASNVIDVELSAGQDLSEVVVIGYGTVKKEDATGSVLAISSDDFNKGVNTSPEQLIQGRAAGVQVTSSSGEPGAGVDIRIRGASSVRAGNDPLVVLDGVPLGGSDVSAGSDVGAGRSSARNPLNFINPNDIESISILKDASATAIYGSRGANGVILITTKKGSRGAPELSFSAAYTTSTMPDNRKYNLLDAATFASESGINLGSNVNAFDEILRTAGTKNYNVSYGGSSENGGRFRMSLGYLDQEGIIRHSGLKKYTANLSVSQKLLNDRLTLDGKLLGSFVEDEATALSDNVGAEGDLIISALRWNPTRSFTNPDGTYIQPSDNERNPLAFLDYYNDFAETSRIFGTISANFNIAEGLDYKYNLGIDRSESARRVSVSRLMNTNFAKGSGGVASIEGIQTFSQLHEHTLSYVKDLNDNVGLNTVVGYAYQKLSRKGNTQRANGFLVDDQALYTANLNFANAFPAALNKSFEEPDNVLQSFFGRVNLTLSEKYLITATVRADGSSRFGEGNRYGVFPSAAFAWQLYKEDFIPDAFDDLKLRVGYGVTGNQEFPSGSAQSQYKPTDNGSGIIQTVVGNPDLKWESTSQFNVGLDYGFANYRITGSIDWYTKETKDLLFRVTAAQPAPNVFVWRNIEEITVENTGIDFNIDAIVVDNDKLRWDVGLNLSIFDNVVKGVSNVFPDGILTGDINGQGLSNQRAQLIYDNQPLYSFYLPEFVGFNAEGNGVYADLNNDGSDTSSGIVGPGNGDRGFYGDPNPDMNIGIRTSLTMGNFDVSVYGYGLYGHQVFDNTALALFNRAALNGGANVDDRVLSSGQGASDSPKPSTLFLEDADFFRLANLTVGYNIPSSVDWLKSIRVYATGQNLFLLTDYNGFDPEVNKNKNIDDVPSFGIDYSTYPRATSFTFGANFVF